MVLICWETKSKSCIVSENTEQHWELPPMNGVVSCAPSTINNIKLDIAVCNSAVDWVGCIHISEVVRVKAQGQSLDL